jgi:tetraacyldisaccharide 4'-kinase
VTRWPLLPLGLVYGAASGARAAAYRRGLLRSARLRGPVVSVGNLSWGGSGKTPAVVMLATLLRDAGLPVAVLSRGYRGEFEGAALIVSEGQGALVSSRSAGDEPALLARELPGVVVAVGPRRDLVGRQVEERFGRRVHILDDGFQHLRLARDLDLVCLSARDLADLPLPAGNLREFVSALKRADMILLEEGPQIDAVRPRIRKHTQAEIYLCSRQAEGFFDLAGDTAAMPVSAFLVAGIARPERLIRDLRAQGADIVGQRLFRDHHVFTRAELVDLAQQARAAHAAALVMTAKDAVRLDADAPRDLAVPVRVFKISTAVAERERFQAELLARVRAAWARGSTENEAQ